MFCFGSLIRGCFRRCACSTVPCRTSTTARCLDRRLRVTSTATMRWAPCPTSRRTYRVLVRLLDSSRSWWRRKTSDVWWWSTTAGRRSPLRLALPHRVLRGIRCTAGGMAACNVIPSCLRQQTALCLLSVGVEDYVGKQFVRDLMNVCWRA